MDSFFLRLLFFSFVHLVASDQYERILYPEVTWKRGLFNIIIVFFPSLTKSLVGYERRACRTQCDKIPINT
jgi:hypothetical protein